MHAERRERRGSEHFFVICDFSPDFFLYYCDQTEYLHKRHHLDKRMWLKAASVLAWPLLASAIRGGKMMTWSGIYNTGSVLIDKGFDLILESTGLEDKCPYVDNMGAVLREKLPDFIKGQTRAISMLSDAVSSWEYRKMYSGTEEPLVLALAGDTGTGKSETALRVAELLLQKKDLLCLTDYRVSTPRGFLVSVCYRLDAIAAIVNSLCCFCISF